MLPEKLSNVCLRELVAVVAGPIQCFDNRKSWLSRAARRAGITVRQAKALFYGEITDPLHRSARLMRDAAERNVKTEAEKLADQFQSIAHGLAASDPGFHRPDIAALLDAARSLRNLGVPRPGDDT